MSRLGVNTRVFREYPVVCPAGTPIGETSDTRGPGCRCRITHSVIAAHSDPQSLAKFCLSDYLACPVWRDHKQHEAEQRTMAKRELVEQGTFAEER